MARLTHGKPAAGIAGVPFAFIAFSIQPIPHRNDIQHIHRAVGVHVAAAGGGVGRSVLAEAVADGNKVEDVHLAVVIDVARQILIRADVDRRRAVEVAVDDAQSIPASLAAQELSE